MLIADRLPETHVMMCSMASKKIAEKKSGTRPGWHHIGADIRTTLYSALQAEAEENGVPYAVVQRWALEAYLHDRLVAEKAVREAQEQRAEKASA
jgi:hypothetical protein